MPKRIAYLGPRGTFTEEAAIRYDPEGELESFPTVAAVSLAVSSGMAEEGVVPIENSLEGSVTATLDLLIHEETLLIKRELVLPIEHYLLVRPGTRTADIEVVYSHPQSLGQCRGFLERCFPKARLEPSLSNAAAADVVAEGVEGAAAIAPRRNAELRGLEVLAQSIQDSDHNVTRFVVLAGKDSPVTGDDKTSLCFSFADDKSGLLYEALREFAERDINLAKIESRPAKLNLGEYVFLIDCEGHREDPVVREAIENVRSRTLMLRIFGSYPRWSD